LRGSARRYVFPFDVHGSKNTMTLTVYIGAFSLTKGRRTQ
jgi:hypothetical protein